MKTLMDTTGKQRSHSERPGLLGFFLVAGLALVGSSALAQQGQTSAPPTPPLVPAMQAPATPAQPMPAAAEQVSEGSQEAEAPQTLHLLVGRSIVITSPTRIKRVSLADPSIAEAVVVSPYQVLINGKAPGGVSLIIWDEAGQSQDFEVSVDIDILGLSQKIHEVFPAEHVNIETSGTAVMLSGKISSQEVADKILEVVKNVAPKVTNLMEVPPVPTAQISLQVRFAEVNRVGISQLGVNILRNFGSNMPMSVSTQQFAPPSLSTTQSVSTSAGTSTTTASGNQFLISDLLNFAIFRPDINLAVFIKALQENNLLQVLAEPNLMTESGKEASFLAGGQFPYPVVQSVTSGTSGSITIQFKEYGIRLSFTPTLREDGVIHMKVEPEVSSLDYTNAVTLQGFLIPALATNRVMSEMDLRDGQSFAIAGLLDNRVTEQFEKIPGIGDIPILGKLFQSRNLNKSKNELVVIVTPHIVEPLAAGEVPPGPTFPVPFLPPLSPAEQKPTKVTR
jgi:pilus assembly protein CpaC